MQLLPLLPKDATTELLACNEYTQEQGLILTTADAQVLQAARLTTLAATEWPAAFGLLDDIALAALVARSQAQYLEEPRPAWLTALVGYCSTLAPKRRTAFTNYLQNFA